MRELDLRQKLRLISGAGFWSTHAEPAIGLRRLGPAAAVLVVERVLPERVGPADRYAALSDLNMMVNNGGRERTAREFEALAAGAGMRVARVLPTPTPFSVVEVVAGG